MGRIRLLSRREFAASKGDRVLNSIAVRLREDRRYCLLASVRREDGSPARDKDVEDWCRRYARLQPVEALLLGRASYPWGVWPAQAGQRRGNICVTVNKPAIITALYCVLPDNTEIFVNSCQELREPVAEVAVSIVATFCGKKRKKTRTEKQTRNAKVCEI